MKQIGITIIAIHCLLFNYTATSQNSCNKIKTWELLYSNTLSTPQDVKEWCMEGKGRVEFADGWMEIYSPGEESHHVYWCPVTFPGSFIAEWEVQNLKTEAGLVIVFFSALGKNGEDIFSPDFPERDGTFNQYTKSDRLNCYHISYYANGKDKPGREISHLRKNSGFHLVYQENPGIPVASEAVHKIKLIKAGSRILMYVDDRKIIDWTDDGEEYGPVLQEGRIGFRQMQWTHFRYRNFKVYSIKQS